MIKVKKGLSLPIAGVPEQRIDAGRPPRSVAILGDDYPGVRPTMLVREGDQVNQGQPLFTDKKNPGVQFTAPVSGTINSINRGAKRVLQSVVIDVGEGTPVTFAAPGDGQLAGLAREDVVSNLVASGLWTALRTRPFSKIPALDQVPSSIFVTAIDTNPLAGDPAVIIAEYASEFAAGLDVLAKLTEGPVFVCHAAGEYLPTGQDPKLRAEEFAGVHPAGLPGTHIHFLDPVSASKTVWYLGYQDVIAYGRLFLTGELFAERVVALGGPGVERPRLVKTIMGASLDEFTAGELAAGEHRVISGSVLAGRAAVAPVAYLGRYHLQVSVLPEDHSRQLFGYLAPGFNKHSVYPAFLSRWLRRAPLPFTTTSNGSPRGMVPIGTYEAVMPLDILATQLLRSLLVGDVEAAINLGCLELDEEDVALCTYACPSKYEYGPVLREMLTEIEKEG